MMIINTLNAELPLTPVTFVKPDVVRAGDARGNPAPVRVPLRPQKLSTHCQ
jgi:hypothetical protein